jgi:pyrroline-5-carboxylate reductase
MTFIGAGSIAEAIIRGLLETGKAAAGQICAINRSDEARLTALRERYGIETASEADAKERMIRRADLLVLAMKPKDVAECLKNIRHLIGERQIVVSVVAGLSIATIHALLGRSLPVIRAMPNTSCTIGLSATGICFSDGVDEAARALALEMFRSVGAAIVVEEKLMDIVTGVSGSGPAYVYYLMEAMIRGGIEGGLSPEAARELTVQTVLGAAQMVRATLEEPAELRRKVTSPNGTTQAALRTLDGYRFGEAVANAVQRAAERAREMGAEISEAADAESA